MFKVLWNPNLLRPKLPDYELPEVQHPTLRSGCFRDVDEGRAERLQLHENAQAVVEVRDVPGDHQLMDVVIDLETGRFHQIRAMMQSYKAPVAGDTLYGDETPVTPFLMHAMMRLPLPDGSWHLVRADLSHEGFEFDQELHGFMDQLEEQLAPRKKS